MRSERGGLARPLDTLAFLLPWLGFYTLVVILLPPSARAGQVVAFHWMKEFFALFGTTGALMPPLAVIIILLVTHVASREPWRFSGKAVAGMYVESLLLALPLLVLSSAFNGTHHLAVPERVASAPRLAEVTLGIGAGLYEELIFRLVLISVLVIIGVDLLRWPREATTLACVLIAAALFAAHHHPPLGSEPFALNRFLFRATAGIYLGGVFVYRGYGPAAGLHIAHNLMVIALAG
jgi:hypothetical protein